MAGCGGMLLAGENFVRGVMKRLDAIVAGIGCTLLLGLAGLYLTYGTLSPCGVLRSEVQQQAGRGGAVLGGLFSMAPDGFADAVLEGMYGKLTPGKCIALFLKSKSGGDSASQAQVGTSTPSAVTDSTKMDRERLQDQGAESLARQAFDLCRRVAGRSIGGPYTLDDPCTGNALKAWIATGALPPYAHPCFEKGAQLDYLGRCL